MTLTLVVSIIRKTYKEVVMAKIKVKKSYPDKVSRLPVVADDLFVRVSKKAGVSKAEAIVIASELLALKYEVKI